MCSPPDSRGRTLVHDPPELLKAILHCFYDGSTVLVQWNEDVWRQCGFECPPSQRTLSRFIADFELVAKEVFIG